MSEWQIAAEVVTPGWVEVPPGGSEGGDSWIEAAIAEVEGFWQGQWDPAVRSEVEQILSEAGAGRAPEEALSLLYWPVKVPVAIGVRLRVLPTVPLELWRDAGFDIVRYDAALIGSGAQCTQTAEIADAAGEPMQVVTASWLFTQGDDSVVVSVDPAPAELFMHMIGGLEGLLQSVALTRSDGSAFSGQPVDGLARTDTDEWELLDDPA